MLAALLNPWVLLAFALWTAAVGGVAYHRGDETGGNRVQVAWDTAEAKASNDADRKAAESRAKAANQEAAWAADKDRVQHDLSTANDKIAGLRIANGRMLSALGGLYDKNGHATGRDGLPAAAGAAAGSAEPAAGGCRLSESVTGDLLDLAALADRTAAYAAACHAWITSITPAAP